MTNRNEFFDLLERLADGDADQHDVNRLHDLVCDNPEMARLYVQYVSDTASIQWTLRVDRSEDDFSQDSPSSIERLSHAHEESGENAQALRLLGWIAEHESKKPVSLSPEADHQNGNGAANRAKQNLLRYGVAASIALIAGMIVILLNLSSTPPPPEPVAVLSDAVHAQWLDDKNRLLFISKGKSLPPQTLRLGDGMAKITFNNGAEVLLDAREHPTTFELTTASSSFLHIGKLSARADKATAKGFSVGLPGNQRVVDVSTGFGIIVDESGNSEVLVLDGEVDVIQIAEDGTTQTLRMNEGQAAKLNANQSPLTLAPQHEPAPEFTVVIPKQPEVPWKAPQKVTLPVSTGKGLKQGQSDPNWRIISAEGITGFVPQAAIVTGTMGHYLRNDSGRSQWLSIAGDLPPLPRETTLTFQTTFELDDQMAQSLKLRVRFIADNALAAVRLNGQTISLPSFPDRIEFREHYSFDITHGFVSGGNRMEFVLSNVPPTDDLKPSPAALRIEFESLAP